MMERLKCWRDGHKWQWKRNFYGDQINLFNARSLWQCSNCGKEDFRKTLHVGTEFDTLVLPHSPSGWHCETNDEYLKRQTGGRDDMR